MTKKELKTRMEFIEKYSEFDKWVLSLGFRNPKGRETMDVSNYHYSFYNEYIDDMYSVENYLHDVLKLSITFLRDRNEHKFMVVGGIFGGVSETMSIDEFKNFILGQFRTIRDNKMKELEPLMSI